MIRTACLSCSENNFDEYEDVGNFIAGIMIGIVLFTQHKRNMQWHVPFILYLYLENIIRSLLNI